jgi:hypothetical protein
VHCSHNGIKLLPRIGEKHNFALIVAAGLAGTNLDSQQRTYQVNSIVLPGILQEVANNVPAGEAYP